MIDVAVGILVAGESVLLCHRHPTRLSYPDVWDFPGGHVDEGETPRSALVRELREELGIQVTAPPAAWRIIERDGNLRLHFFLVRQWSGEILNAEPDEHDELAWFPEAGLGGLKLAHGSYRELVRDVLKPR